MKLHIPVSNSEAIILSIPKHILTKSIVFILPMDSAELAITYPTPQHFASSKNFSADYEK